MSKAEVKVIQDDAVPVAKEILAQAIVNISNSFSRLTRSGLNRRAIVVLICSDTGYGKGTIEAVLASLDSLAAKYTK